MAVTDRKTPKENLDDNSSSKNMGHSWIKIVLAEQKRYQCEKRLRRWRSLSIWAWLADTDPEDIYPDREFTRSAEQEARRQWLRAHTSWSFLSSFQTMFGVKLAASLPICTVLIQFIPELRGRLPVHVFGWCYLAALFWLAAVLFYQWRSPRLLKAALNTYGGLTGAPRRELLYAFVQAEFDGLICTRIWKPDFLEKPRTRVESNAMGLLARGYTPALEGFGMWAKALVERALYEWARRQQVQILEHSSDQLEIRSQFIRGYEDGHKPCVEHLYIRRPTVKEIEEQPSFCAQDLVIEWREAPLWSLEHREQLNHATQRLYMTQGLSHLFENDSSAESIASIVAQWSNWYRPFSRIVTLFFYMLTLLCVCVFLFLQTRIVLWGMTNP